MPGYYLEDKKVKSIVEKFLKAQKIVEEEEQMNKNLKAFLKVIAKAEGTIQIPDSENGYKAVIGGMIFDNYARHPNHKIWIARLGKFSTAAGRYNILFRFWKTYQKQLNLPDFGPESQDAIAIQLIKECNAFEDIEKGDFHAAIAKCALCWPSLTVSGHGQNHYETDYLHQCFIEAGGIDYNHTD